MRRYAAAAVGVPEINAAADGDGANDRFPYCMHRQMLGILLHCNNNFCFVNLQLKTTKLLKILENFFEKIEFS